MITHTGRQGHWLTIERQDVNAEDQAEYHHDNELKLN